jgi:hypothetical protein
MKIGHAICLGVLTSAICFTNLSAQSLSRKCAENSTVQYWHNCKDFLKFQGGSFYEGDFQNGQLNGFGKLTYSDGSVYEGSFKDNTLTGFGKLFYSTDRKLNGAVYSGQFSEGKRNGLGTFFDGRTIFAGEFKDNISDGFGVLIRANSNAPQKGIFKDFKLVEQREIPNKLFEYLAKIEPKVASLLDDKISHIFQEALNSSKRNMSSMISLNPENKELERASRLIDLLTKSSYPIGKMPVGFWKQNAYNADEFIFVEKGKNLDSPIEETTKISQNSIKLGLVHIDQPFPPGSTVIVRISGRIIRCDGCEVMFLRDLWLQAYRDLKGEN